MTTAHRPADEVDPRPFATDRWNHYHPCPLDPAESPHCFVSDGPFDPARPDATVEYGWQWSCRHMVHTPKMGPFPPVPPIPAHLVEDLKKAHGGITDWPPPCDPDPWQQEWRKDRSPLGG